MQISRILRQLERMTTQMQVTCATRWKQMMKGVSCGANFFKQFIIRMVNKIINVNNTIDIAKSPKALKKGVDSIFKFSTYEATPSWESIYR